MSLRRAVCKPLAVARTATRRLATAAASPASSGSKGDRWMGMSKRTRATWNDPAAYPIVGVVLFASSMGVYYTYRLLVRTNDVTLDREKRADLFHEQEAYSPHKVRKFSASRALDENNCEIAKPLNSLFVTPRVKGSFGPGTKNS